MNLTEQQRYAASVKRPFLGTQREWERAAEKMRERALSSGQPLGLDTEFYGLDVRKESCAARARIHVWSMAVLTEKRHPRGYFKAQGCTLPVEAIPVFRPLLEDENIQKAVHNLPVDAHAMANHGVNLRGGINTLSVARWIWPQRAAGAGFGLKGLMEDILGRRPLGDFMDLFSEENLIAKEKVKRFKRCECGAHPCRRRSTTPGHARVEQTETTTVYRIPKAKPRNPVPLASITDGSPLWPVLVPYAAEDAEAAVELWDAGRRQGLKTFLEVPWT